MSDSVVPNFATRDPTAPEFWSERFEQRFTPWDKGGVPQALREFVARNPAPRSALIPGCGSGYELAYLSEAGWDAIAIDFSPAAVAAARKTVGCWAERVLEADFFAFEPPRPLDFIYEQAFLCALPPDWRPRIARRWAELLAPGGLLSGFFYFDDKPGGPPFGIGRAELERLLSPRFELIDDQPVADSIPVFAGKERWLVWRRQE
ncbi:MAG TPA: methyltransferase domain-containing protein [Paucimonas sp.]|nr:methyltransferase domain-containing protein [Paucimonas sp.]